MKESCPPGTKALPSSPYFGHLELLLSLPNTLPLPQPVWATLQVIALQLLTALLT